MRAWLARALACALAACAAFASVPTFAQSCSTLSAGPASWTGTVNTYYPGSGSAFAGSSSVTVVNTPTGAATPIGIGDLLLIVQMQDASIDSSNTSSYGGSGGGQGQTTLNSSGLYEYAVATSAVSGGVITLASPLLNTYRTAAATATSGQKTFQVVRVPQASSATITGTLTAPAWNGSTGGIVAIDVAGNLNWNAQTIDVNGRGFRGGGGQCSIGAGGTWANTDYRTSSTGLTLGTAATGTVPNGAKGEGVAGTPIIVFTPTTPFSNAAGTITNTGGTDGSSGGYPNGSFGRGAPGNAGGGGTDGNPPTNDQNTGGGGGGNYGVGGKGGFGWTPGTPPGVDAGGFGGMSMSSSAQRLFFGGGGGAASNNNCTGTPGFGAASSGAAGGGMVFVRAGTTSSSVTINARGTDANSTITNDASGGGGAGGSVLVFVDNNGAAVGATINIQGGKGGDNTGGGSPHGPGGGGSGGFAILSGTATVNAAGGANGTTATSATSTAEYGSTSSVGGFQIVNLAASDIPGAGSAKACFPQLTVTKSTSSPFVAQGGVATYTINVANAAGKSAATGLSITDAFTNAGITYAATGTVTLGGGATRSPVTNPAAGANPATWSTFSIPGGGSVALTFTANVAAGVPVGTYQNPATVSYLDPTRTAAQTVSPGGTYTAGGTVGGSNYNAASTTNEDVTVIVAPTIAKSFNPTAITPGSPTLLTVTITNPSTTPLTAAGLVDTYPAGVVNTAAPGAATTCAGGTVTANPSGTSFTLANATIPASGSCTVTVNVTMTAAGPYTNTIPANTLTNAQNVSNPSPASATIFSTLTVAKSFTPNAVPPNSDATLAIDITNPNNAAVTISGLVDSFPANLVATGGAVTVTGAGCGAPTAFAPTTVAVGATSISFTTGTVPANATCRLSFAVRSATTGVYANTTSGVTANGTTGPVSNTANLGVGLINIAKAFAPASILTGGSSTVTLTLTNPTGVIQTGGSFTDTLVNMAVNGAQVANGCGAVNALANGQTALSFTGLVIPPAGCSITFTVTSSTVGAQTNTTSGVATSVLPAGPVSNTAVLNVLAKPSIAKAFSPSTIAPNGTSTLTFTITNTSPIGLTGMAFTDTYPAAITNASSTVGGTCTGVVTNPAVIAVGSGSFQVTAGNIPANSSCTITVQVTASTVGSHLNTSGGVATTETGTAGPTTGATLVVATAPTITKAFATSPIAQGGTSVATFTITNPNTIALTTVRFTDALTGMTVANGTIGGTCAGTTNSPALAAGMTALNLTIPTIAAASSCTVTVTMTSSTSGSWPNTTSGVTSTQTPTAGAASNTATLVVLSPPTLAKNFIPAVIQAGGTTSIRFTVTNPNGGTALTNVTFSDTLSNMSLGAAPSVVETCSGAVTPTGVAANSTSFSLVLNTLAASESCTITISPVTSNASSPALGHLNTTSTISSTQTAVNPGAAASDRLIVYAAPTVTKTFAPATIATGGTSVITFTVTNPNALNLTDIRFTDDLPANLSNTAAQTFVGGARGTCTTMIPASKVAGLVDPITFNNINLAPGASCTVLMDVTSGTAGFYPNTVTNIVSDQTPTATTGGTDTLTVGARMLLTESFTPSSIEVGGTTTMRWLIQNNGAGNNQQNIDLSATLPAGLQAVGGAVTLVNVAGTCTFAAAPSIAAGATTITLTNYITDMDVGDDCAVDIQVTATTVGDKATTVTAPAAGNPVSIQNATDTQTLIVYARPTIAKAFSPATIAAGDTSTLTFTLANTHPTRTLTGAAFTDTLTNMAVSGAQTVGGTCVGTTPAALANGATALSFTGITIPANGNCTITLVVSSSTPGVQPNTASGVTTTQTPTAGANSGAVNLTVGGVNITKAFSPNARPLNVPATLTFTLTSTQSVAWSNLAFTDTLPGSLVVAPTPNAVTTCGAGTVTATAGTNVVSLAGGTMAAGASPCTVTVDVVSGTAGTYNNAAANFSGLSTGVSYTGGTVPMTYFPNATLAKAFSAANIGPGGTTTLTFTITNPAGAQAVTGLAFTDTLPAGVTVAATPAASTTCGVAFAPAAGAGSVTLTGFNLAAGVASCTAQVNVTASTVGTYTNNSANVSGLAGGLSAAAANASFSVVGTSLAKAFSPPTVGPGAASTLTFTITNGTGNPAQSGLAFTDTFPANLVVATPPAVTNGCGGTFAPVAGATSVSLANGVLANGQSSCAIQVNVSSTQAGTYTNAAANISGTPASMDASTVNATLNVLARPTAAKAFGAAQVATGVATSLTLTFSNANNTAVTGLAFTDTFPASPGAMTLANTTTSNTCGGTLTDSTAGALNVGDVGISLTGGTIPANGSCAVTVNVTANAGGLYTNTIAANTITTTNAGAITTATTGTVTFVQPATIAKAFAPATIAADGTSTITFTLSNGNGLALTSAGFTDTLASMAINANGAAGGTCTGAAGNTFTAGQTALTFTGLTVPASGSCTVTVVVTSDIPGTLPNTTSGVSSAQTGTGAASNTANLTVTAATPTIAKAFAPATIAADGTSTITFTLANTNGVALTGAGFTDTLANMAINANGAAGGTCTGAAGNTFTAGQTALTFTGLTIPANGSCTVTIVVTSDIPGTQPNTTSGVSSAQAATGAVSNTANLTVTAATPTIAKAFAPATIAADGTSTITFTLANTNGIALTGAGFTDTLANMAINANGAAGGTCAGAGGNVLVAGQTVLAFTGLTIPANGSCTVTAVVTSDIPGTQPNTTSGVSSAQAATGAVSNTANLTVTAATPTIAKAFAPATIAADGTSTVTLTLANTNGVALTGAGFTDALANMSINANGAAGGTCTGAAGNTFTAGQTALTFTGLTIPANGSCTVTFVVTSDIPGTNPNATSGVSSAQAATGAVSNTANLTVTAATPTIAKAFAPATIAADGTSTVTLTLANTNGVALTGAGFTDTLANMSIAANGAAGGTCTGAAGNTFTAGQTALTFTGLTIPANGSCTVTFVVTSDVVGTNPNATSGVSSAQAATGAASNTANLTVTAVAPTIAKAFAPASIAADGTSTITFTLANTNGIALTGGAFTDTLANMSIAANGAAGGTCTGAGGNSFTAGQTALTFSGLTIPANGSCTVTVVVTSDIPGTLPNATSALTTTQAPASAVSNTANLTVTAVAPTIAKAFAPATIAADGTSTITFTLANTNGIALTAGAFTDTLTNMAINANGAAGGTCTGAAGNSFTAGQTALSFTGLTIPANGSCTVTVVVTSDVPGTRPNTTSAVTTTQAPASAVSNTANLTVTAATPTIAKAFAPASITADGTSTVTLTIANTNGVALTGAGFTDTLANMSIAANGAAGGTCTGASGNTFTAGQTALTVTGLTIPANGSCTVTFVVTSDAVGTNPNTTSGVSSAQAATGAVSNTANLTVTAAAPTIAKAFAPATIAADGTSTITFTLANPNGIALTAGAFTDTLANMAINANGAAGGTCTGAAGNTFTAGQTALSFTGLTIPANGSCTVTVVVTSDVPGTLPNTTSALTTTQAPASAVSNTANLTVTAATPTIAKAFAPASITADGTSTVTLTLANTNGVALTGAGFTDTLVNMAINANGAAGGTCTGAAGNTFTAGQTALTFTGLTIPANGSCTVTFVVTSDAVGTNPNTTSGVSSAQAATGAVSNTANLTVTAAAPTIAKAFAPATITADGTSTITFTLSNPNGIALTGGAFTDTLANMAINANGAAGGTCTGAGGNSFTAGQTALSFSGLTIPANGACTVTVVVTSDIPGTLPNATSALTTTQAPASAVSNTANLTVTAATPTIAKAFAPATIAADATSTVTLTLANTNGIALTGAGFTDTLANMAIAANGAAGGTCTGAGGNTFTAGQTALTVTGLTIPANGSCTVTFVVTSDVPGTNPNTTSGVSSAQAATGAVSNTANLTVTAGTPTIAKAFAPATIAADATSTVTLTIINPNGVALTGAGFTDTLANMAIAANGAAGGTCTGAAGNTFTAGQTALAVTGLTVPANGSCTVTFVVTSDVPGANANTTSGVSSTQAATGPASNTATLTVTAATPTIAKAFAPATIAADATSTVTLTIANTNGVALTGAGFTDTLANMSIAAAGAAGGTCTGANTNALTAGQTAVAITGLTIPANGSCTVTFVVTSDAVGTNPNATSGVSSTQAATGAVSNTANLTVTAAAPTIAKAFGPATITADGTSTITFTLSNPNGIGLTGGAFTDTLANMSIAAAGAAGGTCTGASGNTFTAGQTALAFTGLSIPANGSCTVTVVVTSDIPGTLPNTTSTLTTTQAPASAVSNTANLTVTAGTPVIAKAFAPATITADGTSTVTLTITNPNGVALTGAGFTDTLANMAIAANGAAGGTCTGASGNTFTAGQTALAITGLTIPANGACTVTFVVTSDIPGVQPNASSGVSSTQAATGPVSNTANLTVTAATPTIAKTFAPATIAADGTSTVTLTLANTNGVALTGAGFTDTLANMAIAANGAAGGTCTGANGNTFTAGQTALAVTGLTIPANGACTVTFVVTSDIPGANPNTTSGVSSTQAATGAVSNTATLTVNAAPPTIAKAFAPAAIAADGTSTVTLTIANTNGVALTGAGFTDTLANMAIAANGAAGGTCTGANGNTFTAGQAALNVTGLTIPANGSCTVTFVVTSDIPGVNPNTTSGVSSSQAPTGAGSNTANLTVTAGTPTIAKAFAPATIAADGTSTVTLTIANPNGVALTNAGFTDTLANMRINAAGAAGGTCAGANGNALTANQTAVAITGLTIPANASCTVTFVVTSDTPGANPNTTSGVSSNQAGTGAVSNTATLTVSAGAPTIAKAFAPAAIAADGTSTITFTITNTNGVALTGAGFTDTLANMRINAGGAAGGTCTGAGGNTFAANQTALAFTGLTIPANASCTVTVVVTSDTPGAQPNTTSGVASNEAATGPVSNTATLTVTAAAPTIAKAFAPATIAYGDTSTITFTLANTNGVALTGAGFTDTLANMSIATAGAAGGTCAGATGNTFASGATALAFTGLTVPANASCTVTVVVTSTVLGANPNTASGVSSNEAATGAASNTATLTVTATAPTVAKAFAPATIASGGISTLTVTITNPNGAPITASLTDTFPVTPGTGLVRAGTPNASTTCAGGTVTSTAGSVTLTNGTVPANGSCTFQIDVTAATAGSYANTIAAGALTSSAGTNAAPANATLTVTAVANVAVAKSAPATVATGGTLTYTIVVSNAGPDAAGGTTFTDNVPALVTGVGGSCGSATGGAACGVVNVAGNTVTSTIPTLPAGGSVTITITGTATGVGGISNTATIAPPSGTTDPVPGNNSSTANTTIQAPDLAITKSHAGNFIVGTNGTYTIAVSNAGNSATTALVTVTDTLPTGLGFVSATGTGWTCNFASGTVTCTNPAVIAAGANATPITLVVSVASVAAPSVQNFATVSGGGEPAANTGNNTASDNTIVVSAGANTFAPNNAQTALPGTVIFYPHTFNAAQSGSVAFTTSAVITPSMAGWTQIVYRDNNCNGVLDGGEGVSALTGAVAVNPGDQVCIVVKDTIPATAPYNSVANITVTATFNGTQALTRTDVTTVGGTAGAGLTLSKTVRNVTQGGAAGTSGTARPNDVLEYTITYTNTSAQALSSIVVTDATPAFTTFLSAACGSLPGNITACNVTTSPAVNGTGSVVWTLTGSLLSNGSGAVTYQVRVSP